MGRHVVSVSIPESHVNKLETYKKLQGIDFDSEAVARIIMNYLDQMGIKQTVNSILPSTLLNIYRRCEKREQSFKFQHLPCVLSHEYAFPCDQIGCFSRIRNQIPRAWWTK